MSTLSKLQFDHLSRIHIFTPIRDLWKKEWELLEDELEVLKKENKELKEESCPFEEELKHVKEIEAGQQKKIKQLMLDNQTLIQDRVMLRDALHEVEMDYKLLLGQLQGTQKVIDMFLKTCLINKM